MKHRARITIALSIIALTLISFVFYIKDHRDLITQLQHTPAQLLVILLALYFIWFGALILILWVIILMCNKKIGLKDNFLINGYSALVNFFIPGQGGIALRGVYFKKVNQIKVKNYIFVSLIYFMFYAVISGLLLLIVSSPLWQTVLGIIGVIAVSAVVIHLYKSRAKIKESDMNLSIKVLGWLFLATTFQALVQVSIYGVELHNVNNAISINQMVTYTGAANFALFVALTPGAIGIRESFLLVTRHLHGISSSNIIAASVIDRAVFLVFLGILFLLTIGFHAKYKKLPKKTDTLDEIDHTMHEDSVKEQV